MIKKRFKIWFEKDNKIVFGKGRALLLERINALGSLRKAAQSLDMSYRAAWGKLRATEDNLGKKLVDMSPSGAKLTKEGIRWLNRFNELQEKIKKEIR